VEHFDSKAEVAEYIESIKGDMAATYFMPGFYAQNVKGFIRPGPDGIPTYTAPWHPTETQVPVLDAAKDTGTYVAAILANDPATVNGLYVPAVSQWRTPRQIVDTITAVSGTQVKFNPVPEQVYQSFLPAKIAAELTENMVLIRDYSYFGRDVEKTRAESARVLRGAQTVSWEQFVEENGPWKW